MVALLANDYTETNNMKLHILRTLWQKLITTITTTFSEIIYHKLCGRFLTLTSSVEFFWGFFPPGVIFVFPPWMNHKVAKEGKKCFPVTAPCLSWTSPPPPLLPPPPSTLPLQKCYSLSVTDELRCQQHMVDFLPAALDFASGNKMTRLVYTERSPVLCFWLLS